MGLLGAATVVVGSGVALADPPGPEVPQPLAGALATLARDTWRGFGVWMVPGPDLYSRAQGMTSPTPGAVETQVDSFLIEGLDKLLPLPEIMVAPVARVLATGVRDTALPVRLPEAPPRLLGEVDGQLQQLLSSHGSVPISFLVAQLLNFVASEVRPQAIVGAFPASPLANLSHAEKSEAFRRLEQDTAGLAAQLDTGLPEPMRRSLSGVLGLLGATLPSFAAFAAYSEYHVFDRGSRTARSRPLGWDLSGFTPGSRRPADGWPEFKGYYRGVR